MMILAIIYYYYIKRITKFYLEYTFHIANTYYDMYARINIPWLFVNILQEADTLASENNFYNLFLC